MVTIFQINVRLICFIFFCMMLAGCTHTWQVVDDKLYSDNKLKVIVNFQHFKPGPFLSEGPGTMIHQEWSAVTFSFPQQAHWKEEPDFLRMKGEDYGHLFVSISGSDLLIHHLVGGVVEQQFMLFDPKTGKDISKPFPSTPATWVFNRSRTACLTLENGKAMVFDTLSAQTGEPKTVARPAWTQVLNRVMRGGVKLVLTEDAQYLILLPYIPSPSYVTASNFKVQVLSTNGHVETWSIPLTRNWERFVDAEVIDGQILILSRLLLNNGWQDEVKLINMKGETVCSTKIPAETFDTLWNPSQHNILCIPGGFSAMTSNLSLPIWDYQSNKVESVILRR